MREHPLPFLVQKTPFGSGKMYQTSQPLKLGNSSIHFGTMDAMGPIGSGEDPDQSVRGKVPE
jgi:hypothetical protein